MGVKPEIETFQGRWELEQLVALYNRLAPAYVLEVGCWKGGTLWHWLQIPGTTVVAVDDEMRESEHWPRWAHDAGSTLHMLQGASGHPWVLDAASEIGPYDFVFIDADHTYDAVKADFENYRPMVKPGGVLVFHDVLPRPGYGVADVWFEVKRLPGARWLEIGQEKIEAGHEGRCGIGVLWL